MSIAFPEDLSSATIRRLVADSSSDVLFIGDPRVEIKPGQRMFERMTQVMTQTGAGLVYADAFELPRIDYQPGSIRDNFDFGPLIAISVAAARSVAASAAGDWRWGGLYDLRLSLSEKFQVIRIPEPLYAAADADSRPTGQKQFDYVDPGNREYQLEAEKIATRHLQRIGAYLEPSFHPVREPDEPFPVKASIVIPVRNREKTILDAVGSALSQRVSFSFNVIVIDNYSTDATTRLLDNVADPKLIHLIPGRRDLGIGGCWNEALFSPNCGRYAVQLDSDDLYKDEHALSRIIDEMERGPFAMGIGSYTMVNFALSEIPPGLIDHREWTRENGRNNALRINGLGAPRAFDVPIVRSLGFPNVSYGEDYAIALRVSREYEIARVYDSIYLCRRWEGNTDSALPHDTANRYDAYKDWIRTNEIRARQRMRTA